MIDWQTDSQDDGKDGSPCVREKRAWRALVALAPRPPLQHRAAPAVKDVSVTTTREKDY